MAGVLAFDLSPSLCGWAHVQEGEDITADAFELPALGDDLGGIAALLVTEAAALISRFGPTRLAYEAPIMRKWDALIDVRKIYGLGMVLEMVALQLDRPCHEVDLQRVKAVLTSNSRADKSEVVAAVKSLGIALPALKGAGREDAADAVGVGLVAALEFDPLAAAPWIAKLNGSLL